MEENTRKERRQERRQERRDKRAERKENRVPFFQSRVGSVVKGVASIVAPNLVTALEGVESVTDALKVINGSEVSEETKVTLRELTLREYEIEVMDRTSAREREIKVIEAGGSNHLMTILGWFVSLAFMLVVVAGLGILKLPEDLNRDFLMFSSGAVVTSFTALLNYYWGSSNSSHRKSQAMGEY